MCVGMGKGSFMRGCAYMPCVIVHTYVGVGVCMCTYVYMVTCVRMCLCVYVYKCSNACVHACICVCLCVHVRAYMFVCFQKENLGPHSC